MGDLAFRGNCIGGMLSYGEGSWYTEGGDLFREREVLRIRSVTLRNVIPRFSLTLPRPRRWCEPFEDGDTAWSIGDLAWFAAPELSSMAMLMTPRLLFGLWLKRGGGGGGGGPARC